MKALGPSKRLEAPPTTHLSRPSRHQPQTRENLGSPVANTAPGLLSERGSVFLSVAELFLAAAHGFTWLLAFLSPQKVKSAAGSTQGCVQAGTLCSIATLPAGYAEIDVAGAQNWTFSLTLVIPICVWTNKCLD